MYTVNGVKPDYVDIKQSDLCDICGKTWGYHLGYACRGSSLDDLKAKLTDNYKKTQKALGINAISRLCNLPQCFVYPGGPFAVFTNKELVALLTSIKAAEEMFESHRYMGLMFARPCPLRPRHGFVESRVVDSPLELRSLVEETLAADPDAELVLCGKVDAAYSAVLTRTCITYGRSNDGATSGVGAVRVPVPAWTLLRAIGNGLVPSFIKEAPYIELIYNATKMAGEVCQLRDGPAIPTTVDYVPETFAVKRVLRATGDLLAWEKLLQEVTDKEGLVVNHESGSLSSHYAIHCILNKIPVMCSRAPVVGETLKNTATGSEATVDYGILAQYLVSAMQNVPKLFATVCNKPSISISYKTELSTGYLASIACGYLHAQSLWDGSVPLLKLRAYGIASTLACLYAALIGECRHGKDMEYIWGSEYSMIYDSIRGPYARTDVYVKAFERPVVELAELYPKIYDTFSKLSWSSAYGGMAWLNCTQATQSFFAAVARFIATPDEATYKEMTTHWNRSINMVHNGGTPIGKMNHDGLVTQSLNTPVHAFVHATTPIILFDMPEVDSTVADSSVSRIAAAANARITTNAAGTLELPAYCNFLVQSASSVSHHIYLLEPYGYTTFLETIYTQAGIGDLVLAEAMKTNSGSETSLLKWPAKLVCEISEDHIVTGKVEYKIGDITFNQPVTLTYGRQAYVLEKIGVRPLKERERKATFAALRVLETKQKTRNYELAASSYFITDDDDEDDDADSKPGTYIEDDDDVKDDEDEQTTT